MSKPTTKCLKVHTPRKAAIATAPRRPDQLNFIEQAVFKVLFDMEMAAAHPKEAAVAVIQRAMEKLQKHGAHLAGKRAPSSPPSPGARIAQRQDGKPMTKAGAERQERQRQRRADAAQAAWLAEIEAAVLDEDRAYSVYLMAAALRYRLPSDSDLARNLDLVSFEASEIAFPAVAAQSRAEREAEAKARMEMPPTPTDIEGAERAFRAVQQWLAELRARSGEAVIPSPDADIIRLSAEIIEATKISEASGSSLDCEDDPLWQRVKGLEEELSARTARTMEGLAAKARVALFRARRPDGSEDFDTSYTGDWPEQIVRELLEMVDKA